jgi:hypothetical protein
MAAAAVAHVAGWGRLRVPLDLRGAWQRAGGAAPPSKAAARGGALAGALHPRPILESRARASATVPAIVSVSVGGALS